MYTNLITTKKRKCWHPYARSVSIDYFVKTTKSKSYGVLLLETESKILTQFLVDRSKQTEPKSRRESSSSNLNMFLETSIEECTQPYSIDNNTIWIVSKLSTPIKRSNICFSEIYIRIVTQKQTKGMNVQKIQVFFYKESTRRRDNPAYIQSLSTSAKQTRLHSAQTYELTIRRWTGYPDWIDLLYKADTLQKSFSFKVRTKDHR